MSYWMGKAEQARMADGAFNLRSSQLLNRLLRSWFLWAFFLLIGVLWGFPNLPFYQEGLPYLYDFGGTALVSFYLSLGCLNVGVAVGWFFFSLRPVDSGIKELRRLAFSFGGLGLGWMALYFGIMHLSVH